MKKILVFSLFLISIFQVLNGQTRTPCCVAPNVPSGCTEAGTNISNACVICSAAGVYSGNNGGYPAGTPMSCGVAQNSAFVGVIADASGVIDANIITSNCNTGEGLQTNLWDSAGNELDCFSVQGSVTTTVGASGLIPGDLYFFQVDGFNGDFCDYTLIVNGSAATSVPVALGSITPNPVVNKLCAGAEIAYSVSPILSVEEYEWEVPSNATIVSGQGTNEINVMWDEPGGGVVKVSGNTFCAEGIPSLIPVNVPPILPTIFPPQTFCQEEFPVLLDGISFEVPGTRTFTYQNALNCDSTVSYTILSHISIPAFRDSTICEGESVTIGLETFDETGTYNVILPNGNSNGCDSLVKLSLTVIDNQSVIAPFPKLGCLPGSTLNLTIMNPPSNSVVNWSATNGGNILSGVNGLVATIDKPGTYTAAIESGTCIKTHEVIVEQKSVPQSPVLDTITDYRCNLDSIVVELDSLIETDSLLWTFVGVDTFKTGLDSYYVYYPFMRYDSLKIEAENECGLSVKFDTVLSVKPISLPILNSTTSSVCVNTPLTVNTAPIASVVTFQWQLDGGVLNIPTVANTFEVTWDAPGTKDLGLLTAQDTCLSPRAAQTVEVFEAYQDINIFCQSTLSEIVFEWNSIPNATIYTPTVLSGQSGVRDGNKLTFSNLQPNETVDLMIEVDGINPCGKRTFNKTCVTANCPSVTITPSPIAPVCLTASTSAMPLSATTTSTGAGVYEWSGNGVVGSSFDASQAGIGTHILEVKYIEGNCEYRTNQTIEVRATPVADFTASSPICQLDNSMITYGGTPTATPTWNYGGGTNSNISGNNSELNFASAGNYTVTLQVEENGCTSNIATQQITVEPPLAAIQNTCGATSTSVLFDWQDIAGATGYKVNSQTGQLGRFVGSSYIVENLNPLEEVTIEIIAESGNNCPSVMTTETCQALVCPTLSPFVINCSATNNVVSFDWAAVPDAVSYTVNSITGQTGVLDGTTYTVSNLNPDTKVDIEVTAIGILPCSTSKATQSCSTTTCPNLDAFSINCTTTNTTATFEWPAVPDAASYNVASISGQTGTLNGTTYTITDLLPDELVEIEVTAIGVLACSTSKSRQQCRTNPCPITTIEIEQIPDFCEGDGPYQLDLTRMSGVTNLVWSGATSGTGIFTPNLAGTYTVTASFDVNVCSYTVSQNVNVFKIPTAEFQLSKTVMCETEMVSINYTGTATTSANFNWNFNNGNVLSGANQGPYELNYLTGGNYEIGLRVEENGCVSTPNLQTIQVDNELSNPQISCTTSTNEIVFEWDDVIGADNFDATITTGQTGTQNGNSITVSGLSPNEQVVISVIANGQTICGASQSSLTCTAKICPPIVIDINEVPEPICEGEDFDFQLMANTLGGTGNGNFVWSGDGINSNGQLQTNQLPAGMQTVFLNYEENGCQYTNLITYEISDSPELVANVEQAIWSLSETGSIETQVNGGTAPFNFFWSTGETSQNIDANPGEYCLTVTDENGCEVEECYTLGSSLYKARPIYVICQGDEKILRVTPRTGAAFEWSPAIRLSCTDCVEPIANPGKSIVYTVTATLPDGRSASQNVVVVVLPSFVCNLRPNDDDDDYARLLSDLNFQTIEKKDLAEIEERLTDYYLNQEIKIFPNPTKGLVNITSPVNIEAVDVFDMSGKQILHALDKELNLSSFSKGVYFLKIKVANEVIVKRVVLF